MLNAKEKTVIKIMAIASVFILIIVKFDAIVSLLTKLLNILQPFIIGTIIAFILNLLVKRFELILFPKPKKKEILRLRKSISILLSIVIVLAVFIFMINMVLPELIATINKLVDSIPDYFEAIRNFLDEKEILPLVSREIKEFENQKLLDIVVANSTSFSIGAIKFAQNFMTFILNLIISFAFAIYIINNKEKLHSQYEKISKAYLPSKKIKKLNKFFSTAYYIFDKYFVGQFIEAIILGVLCALGMTLLRLPYVSMISTLVGITALVPVIGAVIGELVGFLLILIVDPLASVVYLVFILTLQQIEGTFIYPKVVGKSVGVPAMWTLFAITVGARLFGVLGIILSVPITALLYVLLKDDVYEKLSLKSK